MWAAIFDDGGSSTYPCSFSRLQVPHPFKLWTETVDRLWRLRRQYWQQDSKLRPYHNHHPHSLQHHPHPQDHHQRPHSHQHPHPHQTSHPHPHPHPHPGPPHQSQHQHHSHQFSHQYQDAHQRQCRRRHQYQRTRHPPYKTNSRLPLQGCFASPPARSTNPTLPLHSFPSPVDIHDKVDRGSTTSQAHEARKTIGKQIPVVLCADATRLAATSTQQNHKDHEQICLAQDHKRSTPFPSSGWKEEVLPVPLGLVNKTDSKALSHMVNKCVESYIHEIKQQTSTVYKDYKHLKPSPIIHAGSLYHFKPPNLGQRDFEEWMRKHKHKKSLKSYGSSNIAFGRSISSQRRNTVAIAMQTEAKNDSSFIKCMRGKLNARREVLKAIQDYHINAEARSQLEKRASEYEQEKKERQRKKVASQKLAAIERKSRKLSVVNISQV